MILIRHVQLHATYQVRYTMSEKLLAKLIIVISWIPVFVAGVYALSAFKRQWGAIKQISIFLMFSAIVQLIAGVTWFLSINNMPLLHIYVAGGFVLIALFYREIFKTFLDKRVLLVLAIGFVLYCIVNAIFFQQINRHCSYTLTAESILVIIFSLFTFLVLLNTDSSEFGAEKKSISWINTGLFVYYSSSLLIFYFSDLMARKLPVYINQYTWVLHSIFSMFMYTCFFIALWKHPKNSAS